MELHADPTLLPGLGVILAIRLASSPAPPPLPSVAARPMDDHMSTTVSSYLVLPPMADCVVEMLPVSLPQYRSRNAGRNDHDDEGTTSERLVSFCKRFGSCVTRFDLHDESIRDEDFLAALRHMPNLRRLSMDRGESHRPKAQVEAIAKSTMELLDAMIRISSTNRSSPIADTDSDGGDEGHRFLSLRALAFQCKSMDLLPLDPAVVWIPFLRSCCSSSMSRFSVFGRLPPGYLKAAMDHFGNSLRILHVDGYGSVAPSSSSNDEALCIEEINLRQLRDLRELSIGRLDPATWQRLPRFLPNLQRLDLARKNHAICGRSLGLVVEGCPGLKHLDDSNGSIDDWGPLLRSLIEHGNNNLQFLQSGNFLTHFELKMASEKDDDASSPSRNLLHPLWEEFFTKRGGQLEHFGVPHLCDQRALSMISSQCPKLSNFYFRVDEGFDDAALLALCRNDSKLRFVCIRLFLMDTSEPIPKNLTLDGLKRFVAALPKLRVVALFNGRKWISELFDAATAGPNNASAGPKRSKKRKKASNVDLCEQFEETMKATLKSVAQRHDFSLQLW